jgi:hypothetical protein
MNCRDIEPLIYLVREGELTEKEKSRVSEHIHDCPRCKELARSVTSMVSKVSKADFTKGPELPVELLTHRVLQEIHKPGKSYTFVLVKAVAACLLFLLAFTFMSQERNFYSKRSELQARLQPEEEGLSDCLKELRRKIHYQSMAAFARADTLPVNLISEEALTVYVRDNCGYNTGDIKKLKKMLIQAGLVD